MASVHAIDYSAQIHPRIHPIYTLDTPRYNHGYIPVSPQYHKGQKLSKLGLCYVLLQSNQLSLSGVSCWISLISKENFGSLRHSFKIELEL